MKLAKNSLYSDFEKKMNRIKNHIAEEVAPQVNELLKESVTYSLIDWYNDYEPEVYQRTNNFMNILNNTWTSGKGNLLTMTVNSGSMNSYPSFFGGKSLEPSAAFDFMFMGGEHGHGKWMMHRSLPPYMYVDRDISTGWDGRLDKIVNKKIEEILRK